MNPDQQALVNLANSLGSQVANLSLALAQEQAQHAATRQALQEAQAALIRQGDTAATMET